MVHEPDYPIRGHETVQKSSLLAPISRRSRGRCARPAYHRHGFAQASVAESAITLPPVTPGAPDASHSISAGHIPRTGRDCRIGRGLRSCASRTRSNRPYRSRSGDARPGRLFCAGAVAPSTKTNPRPPLSHGGTIRHTGGRFMGTAGLRVCLYPAWADGWMWKCKRPGSQRGCSGTGRTCSFYAMPLRGACRCRTWQAS